MLNAAQLAAMQATVATAFDLTCQVQRPAITPDGTGRNTTVYNDVGSPFGCNLAQPSQQLLQNYDYKIGALSAWVVGMPVGSNVLPNDYLVIGSLTLEVHVLLDPLSYETRMRVLAAEIRP